jgi:hypothetical protein
MRNKLPFPSSIVTHALVETCVFGGVTYYLTSRISSLEKRVTELEDLLLHRIKSEKLRHRPSVKENQPTPTIPIPVHETMPPNQPLQHPNQPLQHPNQPTIPIPVHETMPPNPPPLVRQHAVEIELVETPLPLHTKPVGIPIEVHHPTESELKDIDMEVEKEIGQLNLN